MADQAGNEDERAGPVFNLQPPLIIVTVKYLSQKQYERD
ncbi:hypothetical protein YPPY47_4936 [Yersinia pestis PY-47]|nr:hypothetical protein YPPY45_4595 [Yersinia pestis PY-45]EIS12402.1 hypothetical protein YPPY47_4936 [Yersinia pestis PY-47]EIS14451.1 hypothetical protein YPPY48_4756 [Yersinia pestis PY-48]EIS25390.1 hypothetical protein YPPY53_4806 [Yersinia pestis PY-53]EIS71027.1 hypothetical protein YPPY64_5011 [Yersinia pestis PY-64]EIT08320.1 hypothetical protein YPPY91_4811 [Yersinia pestis PY-91]EIT24745.1 hypothetical protein YPPY98_4800 [Yersinia pestis PY-98]EIT47887.1 hypothetical protein YPP